MSQLLINNLVVFVACLWFGLLKLLPHVKAIKIVNDKRFSKELYALHNNHATNLSCSIELIPQIRGFMPDLLIDYHECRVVKQLIKSLGYSGSIPLNLVYYYFAQQDLGRFRLIVKDGSKYSDLSVMSYKNNMIRIVVFSILFATGCLLFSNFLQRG